MSETMKDKTRRLERVVKGKHAGKTDTFVFSEVLKMVELAIAEERAACVNHNTAELQQLRAFANHVINKMQSFTVDDIARKHGIAIEVFPVKVSE